MNDRFDWAIGQRNGKLTHQPRRVVERTFVREFEKADEDRYDDHRVEKGGGGPVR